MERVILKPLSNIKVINYSKHGDINKYLTTILGEHFKRYRDKWNKVTNLKFKTEFPMFLVFELEYRCNLKCVMCINSSANRDKYGYSGKLSFSKYKEIIKESKNYNCPSMTFGGINEPLLNKDIVKRIEFAKENGFIDIMLNTNATLLNSNLSKELIKSGLTRIRIGFDAATKETYEKIRVGAKYEEVKKNIMNFMKEREKLNSKLPVVRISMVHINENDEETEEFINFWKDIVDYVSIQRYIPHEFTKDKIKLNPKLNKKEKVICTEPFERLFIRGNGDVLACCNPVFGPKVGNIFEESLYSIWNSKKMNELRESLLNKKLDKFPECKMCYYHRNFLI